MTFDWHGAPHGYTKREFSFAGTNAIVTTTATIIGGLTLLYLVAYALVHGGQFASPSPLAAAGAVVLLVLVHEGVHVVVLRWFGYDVEVGLRLRGGGAAYVAPFEQPLVRWHLLVAMGAPLVALSIGLLAVVLAGSSAVATLAVLLLWANAIGSGSDISKAITVLRSPSGTLFYATEDVVFAYTPPARRG